VGVASTGSVGRTVLSADFEDLFWPRIKINPQPQHELQQRRTGVSALHQDARVYMSRGKDLNFTSWDFEVTFLLASVWYSVSVPCTT
jgi:hypothetical protein